VGKVPFEELQNYIRSADLGLCLLENIGLNYYHSLPNRIFDYPMAGLPILATAFPDISEVVTEYETGLLIDSLNPEVIAAAIKNACENEALRNRWSVTLPKAVESLNWTNESLVLDEIFR
jgi:glycosyltransferase involved in cell wall biosynthesis